MFHPNVLIGQMFLYCAFFPLYVREPINLSVIDCIPVNICFMVVIAFQTFQA